MKEEVLSWPVNIYRVEMSSFILANGLSGVSVYDMTPHEVTRVLMVWQVRPGTDGRMVRQSGWRFEKELGQLWLRKSAYYFSNNYQVTLGTKIDPANAPDWTELTELVEIGITDSMIDILKYGAAWRLVQGREPKRLFTEEENESRIAQDVPVQANTALAAQLKKLRDQRLGEEIFRLRSYNPVRG
jgi:hypothetical protein